MAMTAAEKQRAYRERAKAVKDVPSVEAAPVSGLDPEALCALVDELYMAGAFRGSLARIRLRAFAGK